MKCTRCGEEMINTLGGNYSCPKCGFGVNDLVYRSSNNTLFMSDEFAQKGWVCPVCGRGMSPWVDMCHCHENTGAITNNQTLLDNRIAYLNAL